MKGLRLLVLSAALLVSLSVDALAIGRGTVFLEDRSNTIELEVIDGYSLTINFETLGVTPQHFRLEGKETFTVDHLGQVMIIRRHQHIDFPGTIPTGANAGLLTVITKSGKVFQFHLTTTADPSKSTIVDLEYEQPAIQDLPPEDPEITTAIANPPLPATIESPPEEPQAPVAESATVPVAPDPDVPQPSVSELRDQRRELRQQLRALKQQRKARAKAQKRLEKARRAVSEARSQIPQFEPAAPSPAQPFRFAPEIVPPSGPAIQPVSSPSAVLSHPSEDTQ